jgi:hypothetical protein
LNIIETRCGPKLHQSILLPAAIPGALDLRVGKPRGEKTAVSHVQALTVLQPAHAARAVEPMRLL